MLGVFVKKQSERNKRKLYVSLNKSSCIFMDRKIIFFFGVKLLIV